MLKKSKKEVLTEIRASATAELYRMSNANLSNLQFSMTDAIGAAIEAGFRTYIENQYTQDDFEKDLTLK